MEEAQKAKVLRLQRAENTYRVYLFGDRSTLTGEELRWASWSMELEGKRREAAILRAAAIQALS